MKRWQVVWEQIAVENAELATDALVIGKSIAAAKSNIFVYMLGVSNLSGDKRLY